MSTRDSTRYTTTPLFNTTTFPSMELILFSHCGRIMTGVESAYSVIYILLSQFFLINERRYPMTLGKRRNNATCQKAREIHERKQMIASTTAEANFVAETLFHPKESDERDMRFHVGRHILLSLRECQDSDLLPNTTVSAAAFKFSD